MSDVMQAVADEDLNDAAVHPAAEANADARYGILSLGWTFFVSFFSSLAPQHPPPVNAN